MVTFLEVYNILIIVVTLFLTIYSAFATTAALTKTEEESPMFCCCLNMKLAEKPPTVYSEKRGQDVLKDDRRKLSYTYWGYHLIHFGACCYLMMVTTNWITPSDIEAISENTYTFWIKSITTLLE